MRFESARAWLALTLFLGPATAGAYEVDNFTLRYQELPDAQEILDQEINQRLEHALSRLNEDKSACNRWDVVTYVSQEFAGGVIGTIESWAGNHLKIKKHELSLDRSIYRSRSLKDKLLGGVMSAAGIGASIRLSGQYIGADKLGHFFDQGYAQFMIADAEGKGDEAAVKRGMSQEESYLGWGMTGVKSYGDLAANYSGMLFYRDLTEGNRPMFSCKDNKWVQTRKFSFSDYVNPAWDEAINCSEYKSESLKTAVDWNIYLLERKHPGKTFSCPVDSEACKKIPMLYPSNLLTYLLTPHCRKLEVPPPSPSPELSPTPTASMPAPATAVDCPPETMPAPAAPEIAPIVKEVNQRLENDLR